MPLLVGIGITACSSSSESSGGEISLRWALITEPEDGTTSFGPRPPAIIISESSGSTIALDDPLVAEAAASMSLVTYPEGAAVAGTIAIVRDLGAIPPGVRIEMHPTEALSDRWYSLKLTKLPRQISAYAEPSYRLEADGTIDARFRVGSAPQLFAVQFCKSDIEGVIRFSEDVFSPVAGVPGKIAYSDDGTIADCNFAVSLGTPPIPANDFQFACTALDRARPIQFSIGTGVTSAGGTAMPAVTAPITLSALPAWGPACARWSATL